MPDSRVLLEASRSRMAAGERVAGVPDPSAKMEASILVRRRPHAGELDAILSGEAPPLSREEAAATLGADPADLDRVISFARSHGLTVVESNAAKRTVRVSGTVSQMESAFGIPLQSCETGGHLYTCYDGVLSIPASLEAIIVAVLGLDQRPVARHR
jgi:kumamolisin